MLCSRFLASYKPLSETWALTLWNSRRIFTVIQEYLQVCSPPDKKFHPWTGLRMYAPGAFSRSFYLVFFHQTLVAGIILIQALSTQRRIPEANVGSHMRHTSKCLHQDPTSPGTLLLQDLCTSLSCRPNTIGLEAVSRYKLIHAPEVKAAEMWGNVATTWSGIWIFHLFYIIIAAHDELWNSLSGFNIFSVQPALLTVLSAYLPILLWWLIYGVSWWFDFFCQYNWLQADLGAVDRTKTPWIIFTGWVVNSSFPFVIWNL